MITSGKSPANLGNSKEDNHRFGPFGGPCRGKSAANNSNNSECCWMFVLRCGGFRTRTRGGTLSQGGRRNTNKLAGLRGDAPTERKDTRDSDRARHGQRNADRNPILSNSVVAEGQDRMLTLPWARPSSRRRREIIHRVGEAQPLRATRSKAREGFHQRHFARRSPLAR